MKFASTPLWLTVYGIKWRQSNRQAVRQALAVLETAKPPRMFIASEGFPTVALHVPMGVERAAVIDRVIEQVREVASLIEPLAAGAKPGPVEMPPVDETSEA